MANEGEQVSINDQSSDISDEANWQASGDEACFADLKLGKAWGESITKRQADELEARL